LLISISEETARDVQLRELSRHQTRSGGQNPKLSDQDKATEQSPDIPHRCGDENPDRKIPSRRRGKAVSWISPLFISFTESNKIWMEKVPGVYLPDF